MTKLFNKIRPTHAAIEFPSLCDSELAPSLIPVCRRSEVLFSKLFFNPLQTHRIIDALCQAVMLQDFLATFFIIRKLNHTLRQYYKTSYKTLQVRVKRKMFHLLTHSLLLFA